MVSVYIVWGSTYLAIRFAIETMPPFLMASARFLIAGTILYVWRRLSGDAPATPIQWRSAAIVGGFLLVGGNGGVVWAEQHVPSGIVALLVGGTPLWLVLLDSFFFQRKSPGWVTLAGVVFGFAGIALLVGPSKLTGLAGEVDLVGALVVTLAALLWAAGSLYNRGANLPSSPLLGTGMEMLCGGVGLLLLGSLAGEWPKVDPAAFSTRSLLGLGYLIIFGGLVGFTAYTWLVRVAPIPLVSTYAYVNPVVAIFVGYLLADEPLSPRVLLAAVMIIGAVVVITLAQPVRRVVKQDLPE